LTCSLFKSNIPVSDIDEGMYPDMDFKIPRKNGIEVAREIEVMAPSQKLLMITAYAGIIDPAQKPQNMKIIAKPYDVDELIGMIRNLTQ